MTFSETAIPELFVIDGERSTDVRGWFMRTYGDDEFRTHGIDFTPRQISLSANPRRGTLRGMHFQRGAAAERKLVRCLAGAIHDVIIDLRPDSRGHRQWVAVELSAERANALFVPAGCAHGFLTLSDEALVEYMIDAPYAPAAAGGVRWNDPAFAVSWPFEPSVISERDRTWPDYAG